MVSLLLSMVLVSLLLRMVLLSLLVSVSLLLRRAVVSLFLKTVLFFAISLVDIAAVEDVDHATAAHNAYNSLRGTRY